jgi:hypothetical protein
MEEEQTTQDALLGKLNAAFSKENIAGATFSYCTIDVAVLSPLGVDGGDVRIIDLLTCLASLKVPHDFLPDSLYVRDCMRNVFALFSNDTEVTPDDHNNNRRVLLGSPGVGKAVLFFLAALKKAHDSDVPVLYLRKTREESIISMFYMKKNGDGKVSVFFCRTVKKSLASIPKLYRVFLEVLGSVFCIWIDGPRHDDKEGTLENSYDYLCTSGGHPPPKNSEKDKYIWLLDAWRKDEAIAAAQEKADFADNVENVYWLCGGSMRSMLKAVHDFNFVMGDLRESVNNITKDDVQLFLSSNERTEGKMDSLRSMFMSPQQDSDKRANGRQLVDSGFVLHELSRRLDVGALLEAYKFALSLRDSVVTGQYFEKVIHKSIEINQPGQMTATIRSSGTGPDGVNELDSANSYWIPSIPNFADIDAAILIDSTLHAIQYTIGRSHSFDTQRFWDDFASVVREKVHFKAIKIHFFVPNDVNFTTSVEMTYTYYSKKLRSQRGQQKIQMSSTVVHVDMTDKGSIAASIENVFR